MKGFDRSCGRVMFPAVTAAVCMFAAYMLVYVALSCDTEAPPEEDDSIVYYSSSGDKGTSGNMIMVMDPADTGETSPDDPAYRYFSGTIRLTLKKDCDLHVQFHTSDGTTENVKYLKIFDKDGVLVKNANTMTVSQNVVDVPLGHFIYGDYKVSVKVADLDGDDSDFGIMFYQR